MTERLYLTDAYLTTFNARIIERHHLPPDARLAVVLDRTAFAPPVAGMVADRGALNEVPVLDVYEDEKGRLLHIISQEIWRDDVQGRLDWSRRFDLMQHHTAQHILSEAFMHVAGTETTAAAISPQVAWIELNKLLSDAEVERAAAWSNQLIAASRPARVAVVDTTRMASLTGVSSGAMGNHQLARVFNIEGLRVSVCQAPHVSRTSEIGLLRIARVDRSSERMRVEFQCGARVLNDLHRRDQLVARLAASLGVPPAELEQAVANLQAQTRQVMEAVAGLHNKILEYESIALAATAERVGEVRVVNRVFPDRDVAEVRQLVRLLTEQPDLVVLVGTAGARAQLIFGCSSNVSYDASVLMRAAAPVIGTQGGGQARWAESIIVRADAARVEAALAKAYKLIQARR